MGKLAADLARILGQIPADAMLRERIAVDIEHVEVLEKKLAQLEEENAALRDQLANLQQQVPARSLSKQLLEYRGALFKRKRDGGVERVVYCPKCKQAMNFVDGGIPFFCSPCQYSTPFNAQDLDTLLKELG